MELINVNIQKDNFLKFFQFIHNEAFIDKKSRTFNFIRPCKCVNVDVKMNLKFFIQYDFINDENIVLVVKIMLSTESTSLRKSGSVFFNDNEIIKITAELKNEEFQTEVYEEIIESILDSLKFFKICSICRTLYKNKSLDTYSYPCQFCHFDLIFQPIETICTICREPIQENEYSFSLTCSHTYHSDCILQQFVINKSRYCPLCKDVDITNT